MIPSPATLHPDLSKLDQKIAPLVRLLNDLGLPTCYSCEGHPPIYFGGFTYPMVLVSFEEVDNALLLRMLGMIGVYNQDNRRHRHVQWSLVPSGEAEFVLYPKEYERLSLEEMHNGIEDFVKGLELIRTWYR